MNGARFLIHEKMMPDTVGEVLEKEVLTHGIEYRVRVGEEEVSAHDYQVEIFSTPEDAIITVTNERMKLEEKSRFWDLVVMYRNPRGALCGWEGWTFGQENVQMGNNPRFGMGDNKRKVFFVRQLAEENHIPILVIDNYEFTEKLCPYRLLLGGVLKSGFISTDEQLIQTVNQGIRETLENMYK